ncbi:MAG: ABC transporter permease [Rhodoglobus sp.]
MLAFIAKRIASGIVMVFVVSTLTFFLMKLAGTNPVRTLLGITATPDQIASKTAELGLDRPVLVQYFDWLGAAIHGDFGASWVDGVAVSSTLADRIPVTISIAVVATLLALVLGLALGIAAVRLGTGVDRVLQIVVILGAAVPAFWLALILSTTFAVQLRWFPAVGYVPVTDSIVGWMASITLPVAALALGAAAAIGQQIRNSMLEVMKLDYIRTLRSRGLSDNRVIAQALKNASAPALTVVSLQFIGLLSGAIIIEQVFAIPGLGSMAVSATSSSDMPVVLGIVVVSVAVVVGVNLIVDIAYGWLNPKVRVA